MLKIVKNDITPSENKIKRWLNQFMFPRQYTSTKFQLQFHLDMSTFHALFTVVFTFLTH